jgi:hypothetical protein
MSFLISVNDSMLDGPDLSSVIEFPKGCKLIKVIITSSRKEAKGSNKLASQNHYFVAAV